jgi:hypothetical protein
MRNRSTLVLFALQASTKPGRRRRTQRGSAFIEFVFCFGLFWVPLFLGVSQFGFQLVQALQVTQVCHDSGHMYAYGIDFAQSSNRYLLASFAPALRIDPTGAGGTSVVVLSTVDLIGTAECQAGGYSSTCPNYNKLVFTNQVVIGNAALHASAFGSPSTNSSTGNVPMGGTSSAGYLNQASAQVTNFPNITLSSGTTGQQYAYIAEMYSKATGLNWFFPGTSWVMADSFF